MATLLAVGYCTIQATQAGNTQYAPVSATRTLLYETDAMLAASQLAAGDQARLQRLIEKGRSGTPVTIATIGGSITEGNHASNSARTYARLLQGWWNETFPASAGTLVNAGISATKSDYGSLRAQRDVLSHNPDLVIVEFAVNDGAVTSFGDTFEGLVRQLLNAPSQPAVILLFMMTYSDPMVESQRTRQDWQAPIGTNYNLPMVSYYNAIAPELIDGTIATALLTADNTHPLDLGHAYVAEFLAQNIQIAIDNFPPGTPLAPMPTTQAPLHSSDFEFTSFVEGNGDWGAPLNPTNNQGWVPVSTSFGGRPGFPSQGLESSTPGSTLDFTVSGKDILIGYWLNTGPMGQASVTVDGGTPTILDGFNLQSDGGNKIARIANGLAGGPHQVHIELLGTSDSGGTTFDVLSVGAAGMI